MYDAFSSENQQVIRYCSTCPKMCRFSCPVAHVEARETVTPWGLVSLLELLAEGAVELDEEVAEVLHHCTGCLRCQTWCLHDNDVPATVFEARTLARDAGLEVWSPEETGAVHDMPSGSYLGFADESEIAFYAANWDEPAREASLRRLSGIFNAVGEDVQLIDLSYHASEYDLLAAGMGPLYQDRASQLAKRFSSFDEVIVDDDGLLAAARNPQWGEPWREHDVRLVHWTEFVGQRLDRLGAARGADDRRWYYADSCKLGRGADVYDAPRKVMAWCVGEAPSELPDHRGEAGCCGAGAGLPETAPEVAGEMALEILSVASEDEPAVVVSTARPCVAHLSRHARSEHAELMPLDVLMARALGLESH